MKLYYSAASPFVRKVHVLLHETGLIDQVEIFDTAVTPLAPDAGLAAKNPLSKLPALERDDGPALYDSRVICAYLSDKARSRHYPASGEARWETLTLEATADGIMDAAVLMTYERRLRPEDKQFPGWVDNQWKKASRACDHVNEVWMSHLAGPTDMAHIAMGCALAYLDFRHGDRSWRDGNEALAKWFEAFESRPSMQATKPPQS